MGPRVEGSQLTTFQTTGDMGLGALERQSQNQFPAQFQQRRADQNAARRDALDAIQPDGAPEAVSIALRGRLKAIDQETSKSLQDAVEWERTANRGLGQGQRPEDAGDAMREALQLRRDAAKEKEGKLWEAVDPDGSLALPPQDVRRVAQELVGELPASGGGAAALFTTLRQNGINAVDELVRDALLNPERARYLMTNVPSDPERADAMLRSVARRYVTAAAAGSAVNVEPERSKGPVLLTVGRPRPP